MKTVLSILLLNLLLFGLISCNTTEPDDKEQLDLFVEEVSSTEAWLKLTSQGLSSSGVINIIRDETTIAQISNIAGDTTIYIDSLLPNKTYSFQAGLQANSRNKSNKVTAVTLDTTNHNFTWQTFTFGEEGYSSSMLNDVAVIDENNIWAVGEIYLNDSTGQPDYNAYNAIHWDGNKWNLHRIMFYSICEQGSRSSLPASSIFAFPNNEICVTSGDQIAMLENGKQKTTFCLPGAFSERFSINKIWGASQNNIYFAGSQGNIVSYQDGNWKKIESGTEADIWDVLGVTNSLSGKTELYLTGCTLDQSVLEVKFIKLLDDKVMYEKYFPDYTYLISVWTNKGNKIYTCGDALNIFNGNQWELFEFQPSQTCIRGTANNNIYVVGPFGLFSHFNGVIWKQIEEIKYPEAIYTSLSVNNGIVAASGNYGSKAVIIIGREN